MSHKTRITTSQNHSILTKGVWECKVATSRLKEKQGFLPEDRYGCRTKLEAQQALFGKYGAKLQAPETFCRPVKPEDFQEHPEYNAGEIMAGFHGEYYGLSDKNTFDESMHAIARIHSLLPEGMTLRFGKKLP